MPILSNHSEPIAGIFLNHFTILFFVEPEVVDPGSFFHQSNPVYMEKSVYQNLIDHAHCCFVFCKTFVNDKGEIIDFMFLEANSAFENLTGTKLNEIINKRHAETLPNSVSGIFDWPDMFKQITPASPTLSEIRRSEKLEKWFKVSVFSQEPNHYAVLFTEVVTSFDPDCTDGQKTGAFQKKDDNNQCMKAVFLASISHELRAPLNHILGFSEIIKKSAIDYETKEFANIIHQSGRRFIAVIDDIFDLINTEQATMKIRPESLSGLDLFMEARRKLETALNETGKDGRIELVFKPSQALYTNIYCVDKTKIIQVISNIFKYVTRNAKEGTILLGFKSIAPNNLSFYLHYAKASDQLYNIANVFDHIKETCKHDLNALVRDCNIVGLALSCKIAEAMQAELYEEELGNDLSAVYYNFPVYDDAFVEKRNSDDQDGQEHDFLNKTILLVDDDRVASKMIIKMLAPANVKFITANHGEKALEQFSKHPEIALVLMDLMMPVMDGYTATRKIKNIKPDMPVIALTANAFEMDNAKAAEAGCDGFLTKPIRSSQLLAEIKKYLH